MAGVKLGLLVAVLSPVIGSFYQYFSVTYMSVGLITAESVFQIIAHAIEGAVAGATYKKGGPKAAAARTPSNGAEVRHQQRISPSPTKTPPHCSPLFPNSLWMRQ